MMNLKFCLNSVYNCLPLSKRKLLEDVILYRSFGAIQRVWLSSGHIFVSLDNGRRLVTFDSKPVDLIQEVETEGSLDLELEYPVLTILTWPPKGVLIVQINGDVQQWTFGSDYKWQRQTEVYICKNIGANVTSVCLNVAQNSLYWCECVQKEDGDCYTLYKRAIKEDENIRGSIKLGNVTTLIKNCVDGKVYPMGHGIAYMPSGDSLSSKCVVLCTLTGGVEIVTHRERKMMAELNIHTPITYGQLLLAGVSQLYRQKGQSHVIQTCYLGSSQTLLQLCSDGTLTLITSSHEGDKEPLKLDLNDCQIEDLMVMLPLRQCVGLVFKSNIRVYSVKSGAHLCTLTCEDQADIEGTCESMFGNQQTGIYTGNSLYLIQKERAQRYIDDHSLIKTGHYQSQAIQLSYLERIQKASCDTHSVQAIEQLGTKWQSSVGSTPATKLEEIVDPFLYEYWQLENILKDRCEHPKMILDMDKSSIGNEVNHLLDPKTRISNSSRQTQLVLLSQWYPKEVLESLLARFDLQDGELSTSQTHKWQCILATETANLAGSCDIPVPLFELITHLLYKHKPDLLTQFLRRSQMAWDKKLGMSAFIRRRQNLLIYERALKCIPEPELSDDVDTAIHVHVHILLTSETDRCFMKATGMLLKYKKWSEAIDLYKESRDKTKDHGLIYQMVITALTQSEVIHKYADSIFSLMPSLPSINSMQLYNNNETTPDILCKDENSISMKTVKPYLLKNIKEALASCSGDKD